MVREEKNANNDTDFTIKDMENEQAETIKLAEKLTKYPSDDITKIIKTIIENAINGNTKNMYFDGISFTVPMHYNLID